MKIRPAYGFEFQAADDIQVGKRSNFGGNVSKLIADGELECRLGLVGGWNGHKIYRFGSNENNVESERLKKKKRKLPVKFIVIERSLSREEKQYVKQAATGRKHARSSSERKYASRSRAKKRQELVASERKAKRKGGSKSSAAEATSTSPRAMSSSGEVSRRQLKKLVMQLEEKERRQEEDRARMSMRSQRDLRRKLRSGERVSRKEMECLGIKLPEPKAKPKRKRPYERRSPVAAAKTRKKHGKCGVLTFRGKPCGFPRGKCPWHDDKGRWNDGRKK